MTEGIRQATVGLAGASRPGAWLAALVATAVLTLPSGVATQAGTGTVSGRVTDAVSGAGLNVNGTVRVCSSTQQCTTIEPDGLGNYSQDLSPGTYVAFTQNFNSYGGYVNEIHGEIPCPINCSLTRALEVGTPIAVTPGTTTTVNFALVQGGTLTGVVTDAASGQPLPSMFVFAHTTVAGSTGTGTSVTNAQGVYQLKGLPTGIYTANTRNSLGYIDEIFQEVQCLRECNHGTARESGREIPVTAGAVLSGIDFALDAGGRIEGTIRNAATGLPIAGETVEAIVRTGTRSQFGAIAQSNASGAYSLAGLPAGAYYVRAGGNTAVREVYPNVTCPGGSCGDAQLDAGQAIVVPTGGVVGGRDFTLDLGGSISGTVVDQVTATPLVDVQVNIYRPVGTNVVAFMGAKLTGAAGTYTVGGLPPGTYYALAQPPSTYVTELYGGLQCPLCDDPTIRQGGAIPVATSQVVSSVNFSLDRSLTLSGQVTDSQGAPLNRVYVRVYNFTGRWVGYAFTNLSGAWSATGLQQGNLFASTNSPRHANEAFNDVACPTVSSCAPAFTRSSGTVIPLISPTGGINFSLAASTLPPSAPLDFNAAASGFGVQMGWAAPEEGSVATSYLLEVGLAPGTTVTTLPVAGTSLFVPGAPAGTFYVRVRGVSAMGAGPPSDEVVLRIGADGNSPPNPPESIAARVTGSRLTMTWAAPSTGTAPTGYLLDASTVAGASTIGSIPLTTRHFVYDPVPPGVYFLRLRSRSAASTGSASEELMVVVGDVPSPPGPPQNLAYGVAGSTVTFTWDAPLLGTATSYVLEAGTASGLSNIAVFDTGSGATSLPVPGVPPGTYYVRLRARNAQGNGLVSNEVAVVVP